MGVITYTWSEHALANRSFYHRVSRLYWQNYSLHWRHNDHGGVFNYQSHGCLLNRLFRRRSKKTSKLRVTGHCAGNSPGPVTSPHKGSVTRKMVPFDDVVMCKTDLFSSVTHLSRSRYIKSLFLTHWGLGKMAAIFQTTFSNAFSWMEVFKFRLTFHWSLFPRVHLTWFLHWFR